MLTRTDIQSISPALDRYTQESLLGEVWKRPGLSARDRSLATAAVLIARNQTVEMPYYFGKALDNGIKPGEMSEMITHLAFYSGWANAMAAVGPLKDLFGRRAVPKSELPSATPKLLPLDAVAEDRRAAHVEQDLGAVSPGLVHYTGSLLFQDLWLRPDLKPCDRSLVTVSALIAAGQVAQVPYHLNKAMDNGLTKSGVSELLAHLAFYVGWPNAMSAAAVFKEVLTKRTAA